MSITKELQPGKIIKLVPRTEAENQWSGFVRYKRCKDYVTPYVDGTGGFVTGLTPEEEVEFEKLLRLKEGTLTKYNSEDPENYWNSYSIIIRDEPRELNLGNAEDLMRYKFLKAHKEIANSRAEIAEWPDARYIITNDDEDAKAENEENDSEIRAILSFSKLSIEQMQSILELYPGNSNTSTVSVDVVKAKLYKEVQKDPDKFLKLVDDKDLETKLLIKRLVALKTLRKNANAYYYGQDLIGHDLQATVDHINNPENQGLKIGLKKELEAKTKK